MIGNYADDVFPFREEWETNTDRSEINDCVEYVITMLGPIARLDISDHYTQIQRLKVTSIGDWSGTITPTMSGNTAKIVILAKTEKDLIFLKLALR